MVCPWGIIRDLKYISTYVSSIDNTIWNLNGAIYLQFLPQLTFHPITWNEQEIQFLINANLSLSKLVPARIYLVQQLYLLFHFWNLRTPVPWFADVTWEQFALAESWILTRVFHNPKTREPFLVPVLDMANHSSTPTATIKHTEEGIELCREKLEIASGDELTVSYEFSKSRGTGARTRHNLKP
jgi:hypothetical protein